MVCNGYPSMIYSFTFRNQKWTHQCSFISEKGLFRAVSYSNELYLTTCTPAKGSLLKIQIFFTSSKVYFQSMFTFYSKEELIIWACLPAKVGFWLDRAWHAKWLIQSDAMISKYWFLGSRKFKYAPTADGVRASYIKVYWVI